jgi:lysophospholipase L1-like esterase
MPALHHQLLVAMILTFVCSSPALALDGTQPQRLLCIGDSITAGVAGDPGHGGYRGVLRAALAGSGWDLDMVGTQTAQSWGLEDPEHEGYPGETIEGVAARLSGGEVGWPPQTVTGNGIVAASDPTAILVVLGTNNLQSANYPDPATFDAGWSWDAIGNYRSFLQRLAAEAPDAEILVGTIPTIINGQHNQWSGANASTYVAQFNADLTAMVAELADGGMAIGVVDTTTQVSISGDQLHPDQSCYGVMAQRLASALLALDDGATPVDPPVGDDWRLMAIGDSLTNGWSSPPYGYDAWRERTDDRLQGSPHTYTWVGPNPANNPTRPALRHAAYPGSTISQMHARFYGGVVGYQQDPAGNWSQIVADGHDAIRTLQPTHLLICAGVLDLNADRPVVEVIDDFRAFLDDVFATTDDALDGLTVLVSELPPVADAYKGSDFAATILPDYNRALAAMVADYRSNGRSIRLVTQGLEDGWNRDVEPAPAAHLSPDGLHPTATGNIVFGDRWFAILEEGVVVVDPPVGDGRRVQIRVRGQPGDVRASLDGGGFVDMVDGWMVADGLAADAEHVLRLVPAPHDG